MTFEPFDIEEQQLPGPNDADDRLVELDEEAA